MALEVLPPGVTFGGREADPSAWPMPGTLTSGGLAEGWEGSQAVQTHGLVVRTAGLQARRAGSSFPAEGGRETASLEVW